MVEREETTRVKPLPTRWTVKSVRGTADEWLDLDVELRLSSESLPWWWLYPRMGLGDNGIITVDLGSTILLVLGRGWAYYVIVQAIVAWSQQPRVPL